MQLLRVHWSFCVCFPYRIARSRTCALAHDKTIPVTVPGAAGASGVLVALRQRAARYKSPDARGDYSRVSAAGQHQIRITVTDVVRRAARETR